MSRPETLRFLSGIILVSADAARLAEFYRDVLGVPLESERHGDTEPHWGCDLGDVHFAIHSTADYPGEPAGAGAVKIALMVFDLAALVDGLKTKGVELLYPPAEFGAQSWITAIRDPDGNTVELTQLGPSWLDHLRQNRAQGGDLIATWSARTGQATA